MPGIVVFKRRWSVGSDDLVVPGAFLFILHFIWIIVLTVLLAVVTFDHSVHCIFTLWEHIIGYLAILAASLLVEAAICAVAMRGSILDTEMRASMQYLLYVRLGIMATELVWLVLGVMWLVMNYQECPIEGAKEAVLGIVICNWCVLLSVIVTVWCTYDVAGRSWVKMKKYQRSMKESESRFQYKRSGNRNRNWRQRKVIRAYQDSWDHRCRILFCCMRNSDRNRNSFSDIARLLSDFFRDLDVVPSDVVAGLVLLRKYQKIEREAVVKQRKNETYEYLSGVPVTAQTQFLALNDPAVYDHFQSVIHFMHFALGAYGWPMFLMSHSSTGMCHLCARLRCCCFPRKDPAVIVQDNCCQCHYAALRKLLEGGEVEVVYATYHVDVGETPFFVAVDYPRRKIVISIRGTLSLKDVVTDLNAEGEPLPLNPPRDDWLGHKGMVLAAEYIREKIKEESILAMAFEHNPTRGTQEFELVIVGHSLGAGTAAILAILLRQEYPTLQCFSYSPPGGLLSMPAVEYTKTFITSVVVGKDVVPRIGLHQLESLRADLLNTIKRSKDPKWKTIVCSAVCCGCHSVPTSAAELRADGSHMTQYQVEKDLARDIANIHPSDSSIALTVHQPLYPPGRIIHIVRHHPTPTEQKYEKRWRQVLNKHEPVYQAVWAGNTDFDEVLISPVMIQDHMPDNVLNALNKVITLIGPAKPQRALSNNNSAITSTEHLDYSERCHLLSTTTTTLPNIPPGSPKSNTPPHKLCLETSFTSLQSPSSEHQNSLNSSVNSQNAINARTSLQTTLSNLQSLSAGANRPPVTSPFSLHPVVPWEYASLLEEEIAKSLNAAAHNTVNGYPLNVFSLAASGVDKPPGKVDLINDDWYGLAPLATPESLSEVSSISSRTSSLALNIERMARGTIFERIILGHRRSLSSVSNGFRHGEGERNDLDADISPGKRCFNGNIVTPEREGRGTLNSSGEDASSYLSARMSADRGETNRECFSENYESATAGNSTDDLLSAREDASSAESVTVDADIHFGEHDLKVSARGIHRPLNTVPSFLRPASIANMGGGFDTDGMVSSSPKQVKFCAMEAQDSNEDNREHNPNLKTATSYDNVSKTCGNVGKMDDFILGNVYDDDNSFYFTGNNNLRECESDVMVSSSQRNRQAGGDAANGHGNGVANRRNGSRTRESLPLLSNIGEPLDRSPGGGSCNKYVITQVGKGESSV